MNHKTWLTMAVARARSGLRADVQAVIEAIPSAQLIVPLARRLPGWAGDERRHVSGELQVTPNLIQNEKGHLLLPAFTWEEPVGRFAKEWRTEGGPLQICTLPARAVLDLAERIVDGVRTVKFVLDPASSSELLLERAELVALREGRALPLVQYTRSLPCLPVLAAERPSPEFIEAVRQALQEHATVLAHRVERWFDPERDLEPRLVITARVAPDADQQFLADLVGVAVRDLLQHGDTAEVHFEAEPR